MYDKCDKWTGVVDCYRNGFDSWIVAEDDAATRTTDLFPAMSSSVTYFHLTLIMFI